MAEDPGRIVALSGGVGGARFTRGLLAALTPGATQVSIIANTGDDLWLNGLRICPDLDTMMYTLGGGINEDQGWGRADERLVVSTELAAYGIGPDWFTLGDRDLATHIARTAMLGQGIGLAEATGRLAARWSLPVALLPMSEDPVETWVEVTDPDSPGELAWIHFEQWWVRHRAALPARRFRQRGVAQSRPAPGVIEAIETADLIVLPPSNPVVSIGTILGVPGIAGALRTSSAPVVGVSPIIGGSAVRGMAAACLETIGVQTTAAAVARWYRDTFGILDGWLVDEVDAEAVEPLEQAGISARAVPLWMSDPATTAAMATDLLDLAASLGPGPRPS